MKGEFWRVGDVVAVDIEQDGKDVRYIGFIKNEKPMGRKRRGHLLVEFDDGSADWFHTDCLERLSDDYLEPE